MLGGEGARATACARSLQISRLINGIFLLSPTGAIWPSTTINDHLTHSLSPAADNRVKLKTDSNPTR